MTRSKITTVLSALCLLGLAACNTVAGAGQDMQSAGHAVTDQARKTQAEGM